MLRSKVNASAAIDEFRVIPSTKYEFACNDEGIPRKRLIVFEEDNHAYVRQYNALGTSKYLWSCVNCKKNSKFTNNLFMAPVSHSCIPVTYQEAIQQQNDIKAKKSSRRSGACNNEVDDKNDINLKNPTYLNNLPKREVPPSNYEFGVDIKNTPKARVFVFEENDRSLGRQYGRYENKYFCRGCFNLSSRKIYSFFKDDVFCVPPNHLCKPRKYEEVIKEQQKIKEKFEDIALNANAQASTSILPPTLPRELLSVMPKVASISIRLKTIGEEEFNNLRNSINAYRPSFSPITPPQTNILPGFRQVDVFEYEYGFNEHGERKKRIIVRESDRLFVREYYSTETDVWQCLNCSIGTGTKDEDFFIVSLKHECAPIPLQLSKDRQSTYQVLYKALSTTSPNSFTNDNFSRSHLSRFSFESNRRSGSGSSPKRTKRMGTAESGGYNYDIANKRTRNSMGQAPDSNGRGNWNFNDSSASTSQLLGNVSVDGSPRYRPSNHVSTIKLYKPSSFTLEKLCQKLGLDYCDSAYQFWLNIKINQISPTSIPDKVYPVTTSINPGFSSISLYLTGSETNASKIKEELNKYFIVNHKTLGESMGQDLARLDHPLVCQTLFQESATDLHFETIIHLFGCRIGIFDNGLWKRYGNWDETNADIDIPVFVMEKKNDNYFPILSLKN